MGLVSTQRRFTEKRNPSGTAQAIKMISTAPPRMMRRGQGLDMAEEEKFKVKNEGFFNRRWALIHADFPGHTRARQDLQD
jgi:hypothetical protein